LNIVEMVAQPPYPHLFVESRQSGTDG